MKKPILTLRCTYKPHKYKNVITVPDCDIEKTVDDIIKKFKKGRKKVFVITQEALVREIRVRIRQKELDNVKVILIFDDGRDYAVEIEETGYYNDVDPSYHKKGAEFLDILDRYFERFMF